MSHPRPAHLPRAVARRSLPIVASFALLLGLAACLDDEPTAPRITLGGLTVTTSADVDTLVIGDTALITFRFTNPGDTAVTFRSNAVLRDTDVPCPTLLPAAAYPGVSQATLFILSPCYGGTDTTLTGSLGLQSFTVPAGGTLERVVPFTGYTRASASTAPVCLPTGEVWILPFMLHLGTLQLPGGVDDVNGPSLLYLKAPTATPAPCSASTTT
jgi:hypothetical protein